jgi:hypothetical protein
MKSVVTSTVPTDGCCAYRQLNTTNVFIVVVCRFRIRSRQTADRQRDRQTDRHVYCGADTKKKNSELAKNPIEPPYPSDLTPVLITILVVFGTDCTEYRQDELLGTAEQQYVSDVAC